MLAARLAAAEKFRLCSELRHRDAARFWVGFLPDSAKGRKFRQRKKNGTPRDKTVQNRRSRPRCRSRHASLLWCGPPPPPRLRYCMSAFLAAVSEGSPGPGYLVFPAQLVWFEHSSQSSRIPVTSGFGRPQGRIFSSGAECRHP
ncbi:hypothetical protein L1887_62038 [Cichorium endivia]|nr:hypothetical protein L1887_62038 [Cichorium endivia]